MSMLGITFLNELITSTHLDNTGEILNRLRKKIKKSLKQNENNSKDGMDIALYIINRENLELQFSGAYNPLYIIRNNKNIDNSEYEENNNIKIYNKINYEYSIFELKADRQPISSHISETNFSTQYFQLKKDDRLYIFSDGYADQFGGENCEKLKTKPFRNLLLSISNLNMQQQKEYLLNFFQKWKNDCRQTDDVLIIGVKV